MDSTTIIIIISVIVVLFIIRKINEKNGLYETYHSNGKLKSSENWKNGQQFGMTKLFNEKGVVILENNFDENGIQWSKSYYDDDQVMSESHYKNEELYENKQWYSNGQLKLDLKGESGKVISLRRWDKKGKEIDCNEKGKNINSVLDKYINRP